MTLQTTWVAIQGGTCAGKSSLADALATVFGTNSTLIVCQDVFYHPYDRVRHRGRELDECYFDHPKSLDWNLAHKVLGELHEGRATEIPKYDYATGLRTGTVRIEPQQHFIFEGLWAFHSDFLNTLFDLKIYVDTPADIRLTRRLRRDILEDDRGWTLERALSYYETCLRPLFVEYVLPGKVSADLVISGEGNSHTKAAEVVYSLAPSDSL